MASLTLQIKSRTGVSKTFLDAAVNTSTEKIILPGHTFATGQKVRLSSSGTLPAGVVATRHYWVIVISDGIIQLASSLANALAGTAVNITGAAGTGTHTIKAVESAFIDLTGVDHADPKKFAVGMAKYFDKHAIGGANAAASIDVSEDCDSPVAATATVVITHANISNGDTLTIGGVVITAATAAANDSTEYTIGADATADGTALAATINNNLLLSKIMTATAATGTVTLTMNVKGLIGNYIAMSTSDATAYALTAFSGGLGGVGNTISTYSLGL